MNKGNEYFDEYPEAADEDYLNYDDEKSVQEALLEEVDEGPTGISEEGDDRIDLGPEWRNLEGQGDRSRVGMADLYGIGDLSTVMSGGNLSDKQISFNQRNMTPEEFFRTALYKLVSVYGNHDSIQSSMEGLLQLVHKIPKLKFRNPAAMLFAYSLITAHVSLKKVSLSMLTN